MHNTAFVLVLLNDHLTTKLRGVKFFPKKYFNSKFDGKKYCGQADNKNKSQSKFSKYLIVINFEENNN